ncbi:MAG: SpoIID/LytB domain-containing protein [Actinobacteria bacterium]|uniref:Unannotated protein n=1 Tax=freshwater metagenome TaxID=449393 RepID=A0A6J6NY45_9ZZZZ|nr:SpoIID/LytB domain-containing protein [Actinomycetota bacterium]
MSSSPRRSAAARTLLAAVAALSLALPAAPAHAAGADRWKVPATATLTLTGHGYGHGHGMSQYGAEGAARQGLSHRQILDFYYPGTTWGRARGRVTVLISGDTSDDLLVRPRSGLSIRDTAGGDPLALPDNGASLWRVAQTADGVTRVAFLTDHWRRFRDLVGDGEFYAGGDPITLVTPSGDQRLRGRLRAVGPSATSSTRDTINDLTLESYLKGVVPREIPASWSPAAVRAQAVAARTYAAYERAHPRTAYYQLCDTTSCQVYGGVDAEYAASNAAVDATAGQVLLADGEPAFTQFASSSGGWTSAGSVPYLAAIEDPYDDWAGNPVHDWTLQLSDARLESAWPAVGDLRTVEVVARDGNGDWGGRVSSLRLSGTGGAVTVTGDTFRSVLGLRSTWFTFRVSGS